MMSLEEEVLRLEHAMYKSRVAELEAQLRAPWLSTIRDELAQPDYAEAVASKDAKECLRLLRLPEDTEELDPVPIEHVRGALSEIQFAAAIQGNDDWLSIAFGQTAILSGVTSIPRDRITKIQDAAIAAGLLSADSAIGVVSPSAIDRLGIASVVTAPAHIAQAMGW